MWLKKKIPNYSGIQEAVLGPEFFLGMQTANNAPLVLVPQHGLVHSPWVCFAISSDMAGRRSGKCHTSIQHIRACCESHWDNVCVTLSPYISSSSAALCVGSLDGICRSGAWTPLLWELWPFLLCVAKSFIFSPFTWCSPGLLCLWKAFFFLLNMHKNIGGSAMWCQSYQCC